MNRIGLFLLVFFFSLFTVFGQNKAPFQLNQTKDLTLVGLGSASLISAFFVKKNLDPLTENDIMALDSDDLSSLDRPVINYNSSTAAHLSDVGQYLSMALPLSVLAFKPEKKELLTQLTMLYEVTSLTIGLTQITKGLAARARPFTYRDDVSLDVKTLKGSRASFFSGHTSITSSMSFYAASVISAYSDNRKIKTATWIGATTLPAVVGYLRVRAGQHFYSDVLVGYTVGGVIGWLIPELHKVGKNKAISLSYVPTPAGQQLNFMWKF